MTTPDWDARAAALWDDFDAYEPEAFVEAMGALAAECPTDPVALFEVGGAHDSTGRTAEAIGYYRRALEGGLDGSRRRQATIQMASSMRRPAGPSRPWPCWRPRPSAARTNTTARSPCAGP
ncbi:hypothetical protein GCM10029992_44480 [Glycomyces albus]